MNRFSYDPEDLLSFSFCGHFHKYSFRQDSQLLPYLKIKCKGWVVDPKEQYTINYILINLFQLLKEKQLADPEDPHFYRCDPELRRALRVRTFHLTHARWQVKKHLHHPEPYFRAEDLIPFWCPPPETIRLILEIAHNPRCKCQIIAYHCY